MYLCVEAELEPLFCLSANKFCQFPEMGRLLAKGIQQTLYYFYVCCAVLSLLQSFHFTDNHSDIFQICSFRGEQEVNYHMCRNCQTVFSAFECWSIDNSNKCFWPPAIKWHDIWWLSTIFTFVETKSLFINTVLDVTICTNSWKYIYKRFHFSKDIQLWPDSVFYEYNVRTLLLIYSESKKKKCIDLVKISEAAVAKYSLVVFRYSQSYTIRKGWIFTLFQSLTLTSLLMKTWMQNYYSFLRRQWTLINMPLETKRMNNK